MQREISKIVGVLMILSITMQSAVLWPPWAARQNETDASLRAVFLLPKAVEALPDATGDDFGEAVHRCRDPGSMESTGMRDVLRFKVNVGYRVRDQTLAVGC